MSSGNQEQEQEIGYEKTDLRDGISTPSRTPYIETITEAEGDEPHKKRRSLSCCCRIGILNSSPSSSYRSPLENVDSRVWAVDGTERSVAEEIDWVETDGGASMGIWSLSFGRDSKGGTVDAVTCVWDRGGSFAGRNAELESGVLSIEVLETELPPMDDEALVDLGGGGPCLPKISSATGGRYSRSASKGRVTTARSRMASLETGRRGLVDLGGGGPCLPNISSATGGRYSGSASKGRVTAARSRMVSLGAGR